MKVTRLVRLELVVAALWIAALAWAGDMMPSTDGKALYQYITETSPYTQWALWPGKGKLYKGAEPHGALLTTYLNAKAAGGVKMRSEGMPHGSIIVKENYTPDKTLAALTVMYKVEGYNKEAGDWFWAKYSPQGDVQAEGKVKACISCHQVASTMDYLMTDRTMM